MNILNKAKKLQRQCGHYAVARMLFNAGVPLFMARYVLLINWSK